VLAALAAQGTPQALGLSGAELLAQEISEAAKARRRLTISRIGIGIAAALVIVGRGFLWFAPSDKEARGPNVLALLRTGHLVCGSLERQGAGELEIATDDGTQRVFVNQIISLTTAASCPGR
jgi:hypothetical protein